jgi:hypothetical protein
MQITYAVETEHFKEIQDFSVGEGYLTTTSLDSSLRVFNSHSGEQICNPVEDLECDML